METMEIQVGQFREKIKNLEQSLSNEQERGYDRNFDKIEQDIENFMQDQSITSAKIGGIFHPKYKNLQDLDIQINDGKISMPLNVLFDTDSSTIDNKEIDHKQKVKKTLIFQDLQELLQLSNYSGAKTHLKDLQKYLRFILSLNRNLNLRDDGFRPSNIIPELLDENLAEDLSNEIKKQNKEKRQKFQQEAMKFIQLFMQKQIKQTDVKFTQTNSYDELLIEKLQMLCDEYRLQISDLSEEIKTLKNTILQLQQANETMKKEQNSNRDKMLQAIKELKEVQEKFDLQEQEKNEQIDNLEFDKAKLIDQRENLIQNNVDLHSQIQNLNLQIQFKIEIIQAFETEKLEYEEYKNDSILKLQAIEIDHKEELEKLIEQNQNVIEQLQQEFQSEQDLLNKQLKDAQDQILIFEQLNLNLQKRLDEEQEAQNKNENDKDVLEMNFDMKSLQSSVEVKSTKREMPDSKISEEILSQFQNSGIRSLTRQPPLGGILRKNREQQSQKHSYATQQNQSQTVTIENQSKNDNMQTPRLDQTIQVNQITKIERGTSPIQFSLLQEMKDQFDFNDSGLNSIKESQGENEDSNQVLPVSLDPFSERIKDDFDNEYSSLDKDLNKIISRIPRYNLKKNSYKKSIRSSSQVDILLEPLVGNSIKTKQDVIFTVSPTKEIYKLALKNYNKQLNQDLQNVQMVNKIETKNIQTYIEDEEGLPTEQSGQLIYNMATNQSQSKDTLLQQEDQLDGILKQNNNQIKIRSFQKDLITSQDQNKKTSPNTRLPISQFIIMQKQKLSTDGLGIKGLGFNQKIDQRYDRFQQKQQLVIQPFKKQEYFPSTFESPIQKNQQENKFIYIDQQEKCVQAVQTDVSFDFFEKLKNVLNSSKIIQKQTDNFSQTISLQALMKKGLRIQEADFGMQVSQEVIVREQVLKENELNSIARFSPEREIQGRNGLTVDNRIATHSLISNNYSDQHSFRVFTEEDDSQPIMKKYVHYAQEFIDQNKKKQNSIKISRKNIDDLIQSRVNQRKGTFDNRKFTIDQIMSGTHSLAHETHKSQSSQQKSSDRTNQKRSFHLSKSPKDRVFSLKDVSTYKMKTMQRKDSSKQEIVGVKYGRSTIKQTQVEKDKIKLAKLLV